MNEWEQDEQVKLVVDCISKPLPSKLILLKFFITSRPDLAIRSNFRAVAGKCRQLVLHDIPATTIEEDIRTFLYFELEELKCKYNATVSPHRQLPPDWPGLPILEELTKMASPLFIFASTVRRFISDRVWGSPDDRLKIVLGYNTRSQESKLDGLYLPVLNQLLNRPESMGYLPLSTSEQNKLVLDYRLLLASIIVLETPLSVTSLAGLLDKSEGCAYSKLDFLHSVLSVPEPPAPIRILHLSFRDFLLDPEKSRRNRFWIDESQTHGHLARNCMNVVGRLLKREICSSESQGKPFSEVQRKYIRQALPAKLQYAYCQWVYHLERGFSTTDDNKRIYEFLELHFLHWVEVIAILKRTSKCLQIISSLRRLVRSRSSTLQGMMSDYNPSYARVF